MTYPSFEEVVAFHGHSCPGLAIGYRAAVAAMTRLDLQRAADEDLVAVVENDSCAVDGFQVVTGCTFGKGNLVFRDYGKQVYTLYDRKRNQGVRIAVHWPGIPETEEERDIWRRYLDGDRSAEVTAAVARMKERKMRVILDAEDDELFSFGPPREPVPDRARIHATLECAVCGEKVMETRAVQVGGEVRCRPCAGP